MQSNFLLRLFNFIVPPRATERAVERLSLDELLTLRTGEGLPYADERVRALVWELKYHASRRAASLCGEMLADELLAIASEELGPPLLIPVPMHKTRRQERGHNQTEVLCAAALRHLEAPVDFYGKTAWLRRSRPEGFFTGKYAGAYDYAPHVLKRVRATPEQQKLAREHRLKNLIGSMQADPELVGGRACVVVDDVATTGATLAEARRALKAAGAARVYAIALAQS